MLQMRRLGILMVALFGLFACGGGAATTTRPVNTAPEPISDQTSEYSIGAGDSLDVHVWRHADLSRAVPVRPDGKISTPLVEDMVASGKTASELARDIETVLAEYIKTPKVTVIVTGFNGNASDQIRVIGQAGQPRAIAYVQNMMLLDVLIEVGGMSEFASPRRAKILRRGPEGTTEIRVRPDLLLEKGDVRYDVQMQPGDVLIIPESRF